MIKKWAKPEIKFSLRRTEKSEVRERMEQGLLKRGQQERFEDELIVC